MFKNLNHRVALISLIATLAILVALPQVGVKSDSEIFRIDSAIGGYSFVLPGGKTLDLRTFKEGLDLKGGIRVVLQADMSKIASAERNNALESAKEVISRRVNLLGVTEPYVATSKVGDNFRVIVEIPGVEDVTQAINLIGQTAQLKFRVLKPEIVWDATKSSTFALNPAAWQDTDLTGADMLGADVVLNQQTTSLKNQGSPEIRLRFSNEGRKKFEAIAKQNINKPVALFLDEGGAPISMPVVDPGLANGLDSDPVITGSFTLESAKNLSIQIRAGALPVPVSVLQQETIGATLGTDSVNKSFFAALVGISLVIVFLIFRYGKLGVLAGVSLIIYTAIVLAIFKLVPVVLTLPGIAGLVLSIGMATDANILIFERFKEELLWGKPRDLAIHLGFDRAWNSIKDSNVSSLITSFILFQFGTGPVRGFALTLAIGIVVSLFTSIVVVRTLIEVFNIGKAAEK